ncbi:MAG: DUF2752 domain-containing protein [bacterium]
MLLCPFFLLFNLPCPACGLTRSMSSLLHLQIGKSLHFHPLGGLVLFFLIWCAVTNRVVVGREGGSSLSRTLRQVFTFKFVAALFLLHWLVRMIFNTLQF